MSLIINDKNFLEGDKVQLVPTPKNTVKLGPGLPDTIIIHYTAGSSARSSATYLADSSIKASAHIVIGREGEIYHLVPFDTIAWHAGVSKYGARTFFNNYSVGIELDNAGILQKAGDEYIADFGKKIMPNEVIQAVHRNETTPRYWHTYTEAQIQKCEEVCRLLIAKFNIKTILGHEEISPGRKTDPGPAFPLDKFRNRLLSNERMMTEATDQELPPKGKVSIDKLNIRSGAGVTFDKVALPLQQGAEVKILEEKNGWYRVKTEIEGWVSKGYLDTEK